MSLKRDGLWFLFFVFVALAVVFRGAEPLFLSQGPYPLGKIVVWVVFFVFLLYTLRCSARENFFKSMRSLFPYLWARQVGIDLYIGLILSACLIFLVEGSLWVMLIWLVPMILFGNLATLVYVALHYDSILGYFVH